MLLSFTLNKPDPVPKDPDLIDSLNPYVPVSLCHIPLTAITALAALQLSVEEVLGVGVPQDT